jgi:hypothetical protein
MAAVADVHLAVPFVQQQGDTCRLAAATMLRAFFNQRTFANPVLGGFGEGGLDVHADGLFDTYLQTYSIAIRENHFGAVAEMAQGTHCVVFTGAFRKLGVDWVECNDSNETAGGKLLYFADFQKHPVIGIYQPAAFSGAGHGGEHGEWV